MKQNVADKRYVCSWKKKKKKERDSTGPNLKETVAFVTNIDLSYTSRYPFNSNKLAMFYNKL